MTEQDGYRIEAAMQFGFSQAEDDGPYSCIEAQLIAFAKACERKGLATAAALVRKRSQTSALRSSCDDLILAAREIESLVAVSDAELAPILAAEEERYMTAQGYVRGTDEPGKRWVKPQSVIEETADGARRVIDFDAWSKLP